MPDTNPDVQRSLGRIEGNIAQILSELRAISENLSEHKGDDRNAFQIVGSRIGQLDAKFEDHKKDVVKRFEDQTDDRSRHLGEQDRKLDNLTRDSDRAKGAGWAILGLLGGLATFVGGAVIAAIEGWIKIHP